MKKLFKIAPWIYLVIIFFLVLTAYHFGTIFYYLAIMPALLFVIQLAVIFLPKKIKDKIGKKL